MYGNSFESALVAVVNPKRDSLERWARENEISEDLNSLCKNQKAKEYITAELTKIGKENKVFFKLACYALICKVG